MNAATIREAIETRLQSQITLYPVNNLSASRLGHACERYLYLLIKHWEEQKAHDIGLQSIFNLGNSIEDYTIQELKSAGFDIITPTQRSWKIEVRGGIITGREDIRIKGEDGQLYPAEIKGLSPYEWERLNCIEDFKNSRRAYVRGYPAQLFIYMYHFAKEKGFFILTNKLTGQIKPIEVQLDYEYGDSVLSKAERIYAALADKSGNTIPDACGDITVCENCSLRHICTAPITRIEADIDDGELESMIDRKMELKPGYDAYKEADDEVKRIIGERDKIIAGKYLVQVKTINKAEYTVKAQQQRRVCVTRL